MVLVDSKNSSLKFSAKYRGGGSKPCKNFIAKELFSISIVRIEVQNIS